VKCHVLSKKTVDSDYKKIILDIITKYIPHAKIILFGSRARKDSKEGSDIDIALDNGKKIEPHLMVTIKTDIDESSLPIYFDIVDVHNTSERMKQQILKDGIVWKN